MKIIFCENNAGSGPIHRRLRDEFPDLEIKRKKCVKNCGICNCTLFALVNDNPVRGKNGEELYLRLVELIRAA